MKGKSKAVIFGIISLLAIIGIGFYSANFSVGLDLSKDTVYLPVFTNTECTVIDFDYTETYDWNQRQDSNGWIQEYCSRNDHKVYTNRCELELQRTEQGFFDSNAYVAEVYKCPVGTSFAERNDECTQLNGAFGTFSFTDKEFILAKGADSFGLGKVDAGELTINKVANWYGLKTIDSNNYLSKEVTCDVSRIEDRGFTFLKSDAQDKAPTGVLPFNQVMNYVSAVRPAISKNVIQYGGKVVWTVGEGVAYPVEQDVNGVKFVNLKEQINAPDLVCNPALSYCSDDGTEIINLDSSGTTADNGKSCTEVYGSFLNQYIPNPKDSTEVCKTECTAEGTLKAVNCKNIPDCKEGTLDANYECVSANVPQDDGNDSIFSGVLLIILGVFVLIILGMIVVKLKQESGTKRRRRR